jgi:hypothetical protein
MGLPPASRRRSARAAVVRQRKLRKAAGSDGGRKLYAIEGTQNWFEDIGTDRLRGGTALVAIDPIYAETVNLEEYQVFLTPVGAWADLYVAAQGPTSFTVARAEDEPGSRLPLSRRGAAPRLRGRASRGGDPPQGPARKDLGDAAAD